MHPAELAWRRFRQAFAHELEACDRMAPAYYQSVDVAPNPLVPLPGAVPWNILSAQYCQGSPSLPPPLQALADSLAFWGAYRRTKRIYALHPRLVEGLRGCTLPPDTPTSALRPPISGCVLSAPDPAGGTNLWGIHLDHLTGCESTGALELRVSGVADDGSAMGLVSTLGILHLDQPTLNAALDAAWQQIESNIAILASHARQFQGPSAADLDQVRASSQEWLRVALLAMLYLTGSDDVVAQVHPGAKVKTSKNPTKARRFQDLSDESVYRVGDQYARAIEHWEREDPAAAGLGSDGRTVRPHIRAAHAHLYWTGPGRTVPVVRFLPPVPVKGGPAAFPDNPTVTPVR